MTKDRYIYMSDDTQNEKKQETENLISYPEEEKIKNKQSLFFSRSKLRSFFNHPYIHFFNNSGPEINYFSFTLYASLAVILNTNPSLKTLAMNSLLWNWLDGLQALGISAQKSLEYNHRKIQASALSSLY